MIFLLVMLPVSVSAQLGAASAQASSSSATEKSSLLAQEATGYYSQDGNDVEPQVFCLWPTKECKSKCSSCWFGDKWYCSSSGAVCCDSSAKFCDSSAGKCWTDDCPAGTKWTCKSTGAKCESVCTDPSYPKYCSGKCWSSCKNDDYRTYKFVCDNPPWCQVVSCVHPTYPNKCGNNCWSSCGSGYTGRCASDGKWVCDPVCIDNDGDGYGSNCAKGSDCNDNDAGVHNKNSCNVCAKEPANIGNSCTICKDGCCATSKYVCDNSGTGVVCPVTPGGCCIDKDGDGYGSNCAKGSDCNDNDASVNPGKPEACGDGKDNDCDGSIDEGCCPADKPYLWGGSCRTCPQDYPNKCGSDCWKCNNPSDSGTCYNGQFKCCPSSSPFYCGRIDRCTKDSSQCNAANKCGSEDWTVCLSANFPHWNCRSDGKSLCCPSGTPYWWESDKQCHKGSEPQKCSVPDGSSANCDCDKDSDCPSNKPFCGEGGSLYNVRTPQGFHACLSAKPEYCGNGKCAGSENYNNCVSDCGSLAPKGTISVDVYYSSGANANKPISGASVSLDSVPKGNTDSSGKVSFVASYGSRNVKVDCPDNAFCAEKTVGVDGAKSVSFGCSCNPSTDSDGDGYTNEDERLLGTNPKDASSNFATTFGSDSVDLLACVPTPAAFFILWKEYKKSGSIIQSHSLVVNALNITTVTSSSFEEEAYVIAEALAGAGFEAEGAEVIVNPVNVTLESVMKKAEYVDGVRMQDGILLIATDKDGQTTALIAIGSGCVGAFTGTVYGIGQGLFDDIKGVIDGIWFVITHLGDVKKIWSGAVELVNGIKELFSKPGEAFWSMFIGILEKGQGINLFKDDRVNNPDAYRHFQVGFVYGFVTGYLVEQVALGAVILSKVAKAFKLGQLFGKTGKVAKLLDKLQIIKAADEFGAEIAEKLSKLKYLKEGIEGWADAEVKGLARIVKHNEGWLKGLSEAEAKIAAKHADDLVATGKVSDAAFGDLAKTKLGQHTLKSADATTDLLAKQSKLVEKWGGKQLDEVASRFDGFQPGQKNGWEKVNRLLNEVPEATLNGKVKPDAMVNVIGSKNFDSIVDALKDLRKADGTHIDGVDRATRKALENPQEALNEADDLLKASEMKKAGKTIEELESPLHDPKTGAKLTDADIKYKDSSGVTKYVEHKNRKWPNEYNRNVVEGLVEQLRDRYKKGLGSLDNVRLSSRNSIPSWLKHELEKEFGKDVVTKLLGGE